MMMLAEPLCHLLYIHFVFIVYSLYFIFCIAFMGLAAWIKLDDDDDDDDMLVTS